MTKHRYIVVQFLRTTAATASVLPSVCLFVCLPVCHTGGSVKAVQARIAKSSPLAAWKTLVSGTVKLFHIFEAGHPERGR